MFLPLRESRRNPVPVLPRNCSKLLRLHPWRLGSESLRLLQRWGMVRAGVVDHPSKWKWNGYHEIQNPKTRYRLIDHDKLKKYLNIETHEELAKIHQGWVDSQLNKKSRRQEHFSKSIAVGSKVFGDRVRHTLSAQALGRHIDELPEEGYLLKETIAKYGGTDSEHTESDIHTSHDVTNAIPWKLKDSLKPAFRPQN